MRSLLPLIKKELKRFFTDKRLLLTLLIPGLAMFIMYTVLGNVMYDLYSLDDNAIYEVYIENHPDGYEIYFDFMEVNVNITDIDENSNIDEIKQGITNGDVDLLIIFPENFEELLKGNNYSKTEEVKIYYNADSTDSNILYYAYVSLLNEIESEITNLFDINASNDQYNLSAKGDEVNPFASMIPMLLLMFLVTGVVSIATESIAGEKERGTIATLLITPVSRFNLAVAKIISVSIPALVSALVSFIGLYLSLPSLTKMMDGVSNITLGGMEIVSLLIIIIVTVLMFAVLISIVSAFAKTIKESQQFTAPLILVASFMGIFTMFFTMPDTILFAIPILNSALAFTEIFSGTFTIVQLLLTVSTNFVVIVCGILVIGKMFNSEKIIFSK
ncbi:MAG: ABC transporter permease [bacterium]